MKKLVKFTGALAIVALFAGSAISTSNAQTVSVDDLQITEVGNLEEVAVKADWAVVTRDFFVYGSSSK